MNKIPFIVFEGPDMCGKTSHIESVVNKINEITGKNFKAFKFPVYSGYKGSTILYHLKTFDISNTKDDKSFIDYNALTELTDHAINLMVNKFDAYKDCLSLVKDVECDGFIVDRFDISQYIYDIAWCNILNKNSINRRDIRKFFYEAGYRALITNEYFSQTFDIKYVVFNKSKIIKVMSMADSDRRIDKYDTNDVYQNNISDLFKLFTTKTNDNFKYHVCRMDESENMPVINFIIWIKRKINALFDCLLLHPNEPMDKIYSNIIENVICRINTDAIYKKVMYSGSSTINYKFADGSEYSERILNLNIDLDDDDTDDTSILNHTDTIVKMVSNCKDEVTSIIDKEIVDAILNYLEENNDANS